MKKIFFVLILLIIIVGQHGFAQDYRDKFIGSYLCEIKTVSGNKTIRNSDTVRITKSDTSAFQLIINRNATQYSIATVDASGHFTIPSNPYGEWGDFYTANDSLYYFRNGGSPMGLFFYYTGRKIITSVEKSVLNNHLIKIYPNPSKDKLLLFYKCEARIATVNIYSQQGKLYLKENIAIGFSPVEFNIQRLPKGLYFIRLLVDDKAYNLKFIKE